VLTHDIFDYSDKGEFRSQVLEGIIDEIERCAESNGLAIDGLTLKEYHTLFDENS
jgi:hypothetical protein